MKNDHNVSVSQIHYRAQFLHPQFLMFQPHKNEKQWHIAAPATQMGATTSAMQHNAPCCNGVDRRCASSHGIGGFSFSIPLYLDSRANAIQIQMQESNNGISQKHNYKHPSNISCRQLAQTSQKKQSKFILTIPILICKSHESYVEWLITNQ